MNFHPSRNSNTYHSGKNGPRNRRGMALLLALLCLTVSGSLMANMAQTIRLDRQKRNAREHALQTTWLARHGLATAIQQIGEDDTEIDHEHRWQLAVPDKTNALVGDVRVVVKHAKANDDDSISLVVTATYPTGQDHPSTKILTANIPAETNELAPE